MRLFLDTSALVKRYVDEPGSDATTALIQEAESLVVSVLCLPEMVSALRRLVREGLVAHGEYEHVKATILADLGDVDVCQLAPAVVGVAVDCLERHPLRTLDALQVACACECAPDVFVTADHRQAAAARTEGLAVMVV